MGKGNRNRVIRKEAQRQASDAGKPMMAGSVARRSRKDLKVLRRKGRRLKFPKLGGGGLTVVRKDDTGPS